MSFQCRDGWHCQFLDEDLKTPLPSKLHFASSDKVVELVERGGGDDRPGEPTDAESSHHEWAVWAVPESDGRTVL